MKKILFCVVMIFSTSSFAEQWYVDGGLGLVDFDDGVDVVSPTNLYIRGGYIINENFNVGIESSVTFDSDTVDFGFVSVDYDVDVFTIYARGGAFVSDNIWLYGQIGSSNTELTGAAGGFSASADDTDTMFGFGAEIGLGSGSTYLALNYSLYNDNEGVDVTGFNLGIGSRF